jgi:hypothetical protein
MPWQRTLTGTWATRQLLRGLAGHGHTGYAGSGLARRPGDHRPVGDGGAEPASGRIRYRTTGAGGFPGMGYQPSGVVRGLGGPGASASDLYWPLGPRQYIAVFRNEAVSQLTRMDYSPESVFRSWRERGWLRVDQDRLTHRMRVLGVPCHLDHFGLGRGDGCC